MFHVLFFVLLAVICSSEVSLQILDPIETEMSTLSPMNNCKVDVIIGDRAYKRNRLKYKQIYAARFDHDDNLFVIYEHEYEYSEFEDSANIKISVLKNGNPKEEDVLGIEPKAFPEAIAIDKTGRVLVATDQGLYTYDKPTNKIIPYMLAEVDLLDVAVGPNNTLYVVDKLTKAVNIVLEGKMVQYHNQSSDFNLFVDNDGNVYTDDGWETHVSKEAQTIIEIEAANAFTDINVYENNFYAVNEMGLWFSKTYGPLEPRLELTKVKRVGTSASSVTVDSKGNVVIGEEESLLLLSYIGLETTLKEKCGPLFEVVPCPFCDIFYY